MRRVLFVGMNPSAAEQRKGSTMVRLRDWIERMGLTDRHAFANCMLVPGTVRHADVDPGGLGLITKGQIVVALGNFASEALSRVGTPHFKLPHPSPRNRMINDPKFIDKKLEECRAYVAATYN